MTHILDCEEPGAEDYESFAFQKGTSVPARSTYQEYEMRKAAYYSTHSNATQAQIDTAIAAIARELGI